jgi:uncharacterized protein YbjT (DUF2867 family)
MRDADDQPIVDPHAPAGRSALQRSQATQPSMLPPDARPRTVLVVGAGGFIGGFIAAALRDAGWRVLRGVRDARAADDRACDLSTMTTPAQWLPLLDGVDAVVNAAGILRERRQQSFESIHLHAPIALARACIAGGVVRLVQVSAIGRPEDSEFIASKHRADEALLALPLEVVVLRPSVVYSASGAYGGTSLLRALAALPGALVLPGDGRWLLQPVAAEDLAEITVRALEQPARGLFEVGGPEALSLRDYQLRWRRWFGLSAGPILRMPQWLISLAAEVGEMLGRGPMGRSTWRMLRAGNVTGSDAGARLQAAFGFTPRALDGALASRACQVQDRWHAQIALLREPLRIGVVLLFLLSAWAGFATPAAQIEQIAEGSLLAQLAPVTLARVAGGIDMLLAAGLLLRWREREMVAAMLLLVLGYTLAFGIALPAAWLDPLGGLAKNLVILPALALLWVIVKER